MKIQKMRVKKSHHHLQTFPFILYIPFPNIYMWITKDDIKQQTYVYAKAPSLYRFWASQVP